MTDDAGKPANPKRPNGLRSDEWFARQDSYGFIYRSWMKNQGHAARMFVSGVDPSVRPRELAAALHKPRKLFACCIDIGKRATNTRTNAEESADWIAVNKVRSIRLVTTDWHMRRALLEFTEDVPAEVNVLPDSIASSPTLATLFLEYNKYLARRFALWGGV